MSIRHRKNPLTERYHQKLLNLPPSGGGGCHTALLGTANLGVMAGLSDEEIFNDLREHVDDSMRPVPDQEIQDAIYKARIDYDERLLSEERVGSRRRAGASPHPHQRPKKPLISRSRGKDILADLISQGKGACEDDFLQASPVTLPEDPQKQSVVLLETLYRSDDLLFLGDRCSPGYPGKNLLTVEKWLSWFRNGYGPPPHIIPNPLSGRKMPTRTGDKKTWRGDHCVSSFRFALVEFDDLSREDQLAFWAAVDLPVCALIDTGGKSLHGWVATGGVEDLQSWESQIKTNLFMDLLEPLGVDPACKNPARLSRMPGYLRETQRHQICLYLNPIGRKIKV